MIQRMSSWNTTKKKEFPNDTFSNNNNNNNANIDMVIKNFIHIKHFV